MGKKYCITAGILCLFTLAGLRAEKGASFSFDELKNAPKITLGEPLYFQSNDGVKLAYYTQSPKSGPIAILVFVHGGGAHSTAGYQYLAHGLSANHNVLVYLLDLRGHGRSGGPRGDTPTVEQVWTDLKLFIDFVKAKHRGIPLYLGGHSSGGGLVLNYLSWPKRTAVDGYIFISPHFGYKSGTERTDIKYPFARVDTRVFVENAMSHGKKYGHKPAVFFNYPEESLKNDPLLLRFITCNMSNALTPQSPKLQFSTINKHFALFVGEMDELFIPQKVVSYAELADKKLRQKSIAEVVKGAKHLSILLKADELIYRAIQNWR
jgi:acylglycerol lipase